MNSTASLNAGSLAATPLWFPQRLDPVSDRLLLVEKSEADYRDCAFLDERSLKPDAVRHGVEWWHLAAAFPPRARRDLQYIFHIGHVGSTLISRLMGELPGILSLREPLILRTFAERLEERGRPEALWDPESIAGRLDVLAALLSRTFRAEQRALVKATSFVSEIAADLVPTGSRALLIYARPERYAQTILAGPNSRQELAMTAQARLKRLHRAAGEPRWKLWEMGEGEKVAMAWAAEMASLGRAAEAVPEGSATWLDFDAFLAAPAESLAALTAFFGVPLDSAGAEHLAADPLMRRYSKAAEYEYSRELREAVLAEARREQAPALAAARRWLDSAARISPPVAAALERAASTDAGPAANP
ncbi:MAG TPA: hypothetical protein VEA60_07495 [Allosphingosinicella sp.]|nr:hypothetical protein [Allosphingosinicella sp.]